MDLSTREIHELRNLAKKVLEISQHPVQKENIALWKSLNSLKRVRPLILCTVPGEIWSELIPEAALAIEDPYYRRIELELRKRIYKWEYIKDDDVITSRIYVPVIHAVSDWVDGRIRPYTGDARHSGKFEPCIEHFDDLKKLKYPQLQVDKKLSLELLEKTQDILGDILRVVDGAPYTAGNYHSTLGWGTSLIDILVEMRGLEKVYMDLYDNPDFIHEAMELLYKGTEHIFDRFEEENILRRNNGESVVGPGGLGFTDELPEDGCGNEKPVTTGVLWGYAQAQEFSEVSPEMLEEFVLPYQSKMLKRFGLNYYGCCEPNDKKWKIIKNHIPNLRAVSVSPWADHETAVEEIGNNYVYSWKPNPSTMITTFNEDFIRSEIDRVFRMTKDCCVAVSLRDTQNIEGNPSRLAKWTAIAKEIASEY
jgi:hypothetical protein